MKISMTPNQIIGLNNLVHTWMKSRRNGVPRENMHQNDGLICDICGSGKDALFIKHSPNLTIIRPYSTNHAHAENNKWRLCQLCCDHLIELSNREKIYMNLIEHVVDNNSEAEKILKINDLIPASKRGYDLALLDSNAEKGPLYQNSHMSMNIKHDSNISFTTMRITGKTRGDGNLIMGTGFIFGFKSWTDAFQYWPGIITNKHVIEECNEITLYYALQENGKRLFSESTEKKINLGDNSLEHELVVPHPDPDIDLVCILPLDHSMEIQVNQQNKIGFLQCRREDIPSSWYHEHIRESDNVVVPGYPDGNWDWKNNISITRRGILATPYEVDYANRHEFLIDITVHEGSSGSPVFVVYDSVCVQDGGKYDVSLRKFYLVGILYKKHFENVPEMSIGRCIKSDMILDFEEEVQRRYVKYLVSFIEKESGLSSMEAHAFYKKEFMKGRDFPPGYDY